VPTFDYPDTAARMFQRHLFDDLGFHRLQMEIYGFNERAMRHAERAGFVHEGVRRKAYWRNEQWVDGDLYRLVVEVASGRQTCSEQLGLGWEEFAPWPVGETL